ncbi:MAG: glutamate 5-kinase [Candidatus Nanopelagicales bacterium]
MPRSVVGRADRVVVKIGSSSLTLPGGEIDAQRIAAVADLVSGARADGRQVVLVTSGAVAGAMGPLNLKTRPQDLATQQAAASVGQGALMALYAEEFRSRGLVVGQILLTAQDMVRRAGYRNAQRTMYRLLELGVVPIVNENDTVATDELRFGDNDRLAALVAHLVHAEALVLLSDVPGLYDGPPSHPGSALIGEVTDPADLSDVDVTRRGSGVGSGGMRTKVDAAQLAAGAGIPVLLAAADDAADALAGRPVGTLFHPTGKRIPTRLLWLAHAASPEGALELDPGAVTAVVSRRKSLLPAGIRAVRGDFAAGDPVDLLDENGRVVARGLVNFDSTELPGLLGRSTRELAAELGSAYEREIVHRDDLVVLG